MNSGGYIHSLVDIYWWKYYDLLTKSVDSTDSDNTLKTNEFVSFIFHTSIIYPLPIQIIPSSIYSPYSFIHITCFLLLWGLNPPPWGSEPNALTTIPRHQFKKLSSKWTWSLAFQVLLTYWRTTEYFSISHWSSVWFLQSSLPVFMKYILFNKNICDQ